MESFDWSSFIEIGKPMIFYKELGKTQEKLNLFIGTRNIRLSSGKENYLPN